MKLHTRWKRKYPNIIGKRFFDGGEYGLGYFTVLKAWKCKVYNKASAFAPDGARWFDKEMILIKTDTGLKYKVPFCPWKKITDEDGKLWSKYFNEKPW